MQLSKWRGFALIAALFSLSWGADALAATEDFVGEWLNFNRNTRSIKRVIIHEDMTISVYGACGGGECDWSGYLGMNPEVKTFGRSVLDKDHSHAMSAYDFGPIVSKLVMQRYGRYYLKFSNYNEFKDGTQRQNYQNSEWFYRKR